ncbi:hypothetical protein KIN20_025576 [Parelaphostrongylus tenuis]|uniref:Uncharacterized protein n=1 Tax=Parelaphostrongylus tenuis TaxID=148309 RepID=A0AAD5MZM1_PARTN|nr:hypothetical protein KIN20_025576 [Parelaphostrongylus tenuis]
MGRRADSVYSPPPSLIPLVKIGAPQEDVHRHKKKKLLEAALKGSGLEKCRWILCEYSDPLGALINDDGSAKKFSPRHEIDNGKILHQPFSFRNPRPGLEFATGKNHAGLYHLKYVSM